MGIEERFEVTEYLLVGSDKTHYSDSIFVKKLKGRWAIVNAYNLYFNRRTEKFEYLPFNSSLTYTWVMQHSYKDLKQAMEAAVAREVPNVPQGAARPQVTQDAQPTSREGVDRHG